MKQTTETKRVPDVGEVWVAMASTGYGEQPEYYYIESPSHVGRYIIHLWTVKTSLECSVWHGSNRLPDNAKHFADSLAEAYEKHRNDLWVEGKRLLEKMDRDLAFVIDAARKGGTMLEMNHRLQIALRSNSKQHAEPQQSGEGQ